MWHVTVSGPKSSAAQAKTALGRFEVLHERDRGMDEHAQENSKKKQPQAFLTVLAADIDQVVKAVLPLGWVLRMHGPEPEPLEQPVVDPFADLYRRIAELEAKVSA